MRTWTRVLIGGYGRHNTRQQNRVLLDDGFGGNCGGVGGEKYIIYAMRWDVYMNNKKDLTNGGYSMEVSGSNGKKVL